MKAKIKFYLPCNSLSREVQPPILPSEISENAVVGGRLDFAGECECVCPSLFQGAIGSLGGGVYQVDVGSIPDLGRTSQDLKIQRMWAQVEKALEIAEEFVEVFDDEYNVATAARETLFELQEIYR
jgi:hypothetical protein